MNNKKGFTFVELLMVMLILGFIASLTVPLVKNLLNKQDIYRAYQKKAINDVTNAYSLIMLKTRNRPDLASAAGMRNTFAMVMNGTPTDANQDMNWIVGDNGFPGIIVNKKAVILFNIEDVIINRGNDEAGDPIVDQYRNTPVIYYDANGYEVNDNGQIKNNPNLYCKDRYKFLIINDRVMLDPNTCSECINMAINN